MEFQISSTRSVAILIFDEIEVLDFAGPFEVFSVANRVARKNGALLDPFKVRLVADRHRTIKARGDFPVVPHQVIGELDRADVLIVPGGLVDQPLGDEAVIDWVARLSAKAELTASVCTGAFILAAAGLLNNLSVTTHWEDIAELRAAYPGLDVRENVSWIDRGRVVTSAGISAGIDMSLHLVRRLTSEELARATARQMEYVWRDQGQLARMRGAP